MESLTRGRASTARPHLGLKYFTLIIAPLHVQARVTIR